MKLKTVRRDVLLRAARRGELYAKCVGHYTDDYAFDAAHNFGKTAEFKPVFLLTEGVKWEDAPEGCVRMRESEFRTKSGGAWKNLDRDPEVINFNVHSNSHYDLKIVKGK